MKCCQNCRPAAIEVRGARKNNLKDIDVDIPLGGIVGVAGVSGSGKSSLALGVVYSEGARRYLESLSTYTRRRMTQAARAEVDEVRYVPAALALRQRPGVPGMRSTFGTMTELLNSLRLMFSRLASHRCPNGHYLAPSLDVAAEREQVCPECGARFYAPGAEDLAFNSNGACRRCDGTGTVRTVDLSTIVPDDSLTIDEGAVAPWQSLMWSLMKDIARDHLGVRTDVPWRDLTDRERDIVLHAPPEKHHMVYQIKKDGRSGEMDFTFFNAIHTVENALKNVKDEKGFKRVAKFLREEPCPECGGTRLSAAARAPLLRGISLDAATAMTLAELDVWVRGVPASLPAPMRKMAERICESFHDTSRRLVDLGLSYLSLDRAAATLSTGERQRTQLARAVRNRTTGVLYVLDEPSIGLHPSNITGLLGVMDDLKADGNSVLLVDHDPQVLGHSDWIVELGPEAGAKGGHVIAQGTVDEIARNPKSQIGPFLRNDISATEDAKISKNEYQRPLREGAKCISLSTGPIHTVQPLEVIIPRGAMTVVTGVSGSGKTTMVLESLVPALAASARGNPLPAHVKRIVAPGVTAVKLIDATPIGVNIRSTVATYADIHDELRKAFAKTGDAKERKFKAGDFSYNTGSLRCPTCDGTGEISLDVQFLPDVDIPCPDCHGSRYAKTAFSVRRGGVSLPELMELSVDEAISACADMPLVRSRLQTLHDIGLGYLTLGEATPGLSGGEAQRLKLASEMGRAQDGSVFVFDEPTIGLHPLDVRTLMGVFRHLMSNGATVVVIEHDLDVIRAADHIIDMGPGGGKDGGRIVATGTPREIAANKSSVTGRYITHLFNSHA